MKIAILVRTWDIDSDEQTFQWQTVDGKDLSEVYKTEEDALKNKPEGYRHIGI